MLSSFLLSFRESLEAGLIIGVILVYLVQTSRKDLSKFVWLGTALGFIISVVVGYIGFSQAKELGEESEQAFQGVMMLVAAGLIIYFTAWVGNQSNKFNNQIKNKIGNNTNAVGLMLLAFLSVFREGAELVIFTLTKITEKASDIALGSIAGILGAAALSYVIFKSSVKFNLKLIFKVLGLILIYIGGQLFTEGMLKFITINGSFEILITAVYIIPSLYFFLRNDIKSLIKKQ